MNNFSKAFVVATALIMGQSVTASAAGLLPPPIMEPIPIPEPIPVREIYLRSYIGITNQEIDDFTNNVIAAGPFNIIDHDFDSSPFIGFGIGYVRSDRFRFDVTGEYRGKSDFHGLDTFSNCFLGSGVCTNEYTGIKSEWLFLTSAYVDLGTHRGFTPYVGAGIGAAEITLDNFSDVNQIAGGLHWAEDNSEWNFAWALHAGFSYAISPDLSFDMGYRYTYLGDGVTGKFSTFDPSVTSPGPLTLEDITSHDVHIGLRWALGSDGCCVSEPMPISYK